MKTLLRFALLLAALAGLASTAARAETAALEGILITASNTPGQTDRRLAPYESTLKRILRFESFHYVGSDSTELGVPATGNLALGDGHDLQITTEHADGKSVQVRVRWTGNGRMLMNTGLTLRPGVPAVLGGPATRDGEVYAVILIGK